MTLTGANLLALSGQLLCLIAAAAIVSALVRVDAAGVRFLYWRVVLGISLLLPWLPATSVATGRVTTDALAARMVAGTDVRGDPAAAVYPTWPEGLIDLLVPLAVAGALARVAWLLAGLRKLRRLRSAAATAPACADHADLAALIGTNADIRYVDTVSHPVTFGLTRPIILLPSALRAASADVRRAVLAHELIHVQRRDWAWVLAEELVRAAFWFHPAMWWLVSRVQLAREESVDELAVLVTGKRRVYAEALIAFADTSSLVSAAAFAKRSHLFRRVTLIAKEAVMSPTRIALSLVVSMAVVAGSGWYAAVAFPLQSAAQAMAGSPGPLEQQARPVTPENPVPRRTVLVEPQLPAIAPPDAFARVRVIVTVDQSGRVAEARGDRIETRWGRLSLVDELLPGRDRQSSSRLVTRGDPPTESDRHYVREVMPALVGAAVQAARQWLYDPPFQAPLSFPVELTFGDPSTAQAGVDRFEPAPLRVGGPVRAPKQVKRVAPVYPPEAKAAGLHGVVICEIRIDAEGRVNQTRLMRSVPGLDEAALAAVRQWEYEPTLMNGQPVPILMTVTVNFVLD